MKRDHYWTNEKIGHIIYSWGLSISELKVHENINKVLLQLTPYVFNMAISWTIGVGVTSL